MASLVDSRVSPLTLCANTDYLDLLRRTFACYCAMFVSSHHPDVEFLCLNYIANQALPAMLLIIDMPHLELGHFRLVRKKVK